MNFLRNVVRGSFVIPGRVDLQKATLYQRSLAPTDRTVRGTPRDQVIPYEVSIKYLKSREYQETYRGLKVWESYRRPHKGHFPPETTRQSCIRKNVIKYGSPCPICRDEFLVLHYLNLDLLKQFINPYNGEILSFQITSICLRRYKELVVAINKARNLGLLTFDLPYRKYDYSDYYDAKH